MQAVPFAFEMYDKHIEEMFYKTTSRFKLKQRDEAF